MSPEWASISTTNTENVLWLRWSGLNLSRTLTGDERNSGVVALDCFSTTPEWNGDNELLSVQSGDEPFKDRYTVSDYLIVSHGEDRCLGVGVYGNNYFGAANSGKVLNCT